MTTDYSNFVYGGTAVPSLKVDSRPLRPGENPLQMDTADDFNMPWVALGAVRSALTAGSYHGFTELSSGDVTALMTGSGNRRIGVRASDHHLIFWDGTSLNDLSAGGGGGGYSTLYDGATPRTVRTNLKVDGTLLSFQDGTGGDSTKTILSAPGLVPATRTLTAGLGVSAIGDLSTGRTVALSGTVAYTGVGTGQTAGWTIQNTTAALVGAQIQNSPMLVLEGQGWKTNTTAGSQVVQFALQTGPAPGAANPTGNLLFFSQVNGAGWNQRASLSDAGDFVATTINADAGVYGSTLGIFPFAASYPASVNAPDIDYTGATATFATGALTLYSAARLTTGTLAFVGASTASDVTGLWARAVTKGANATVTRSSAVYLTATGAEGTTVAECVANRVASMSNGNSVGCYLAANNGTEAGTFGIYKQFGAYYGALMNGGATFLFYNYAAGYLNAHLYAYADNSIDLGQAADGWRVVYTYKLAGSVASGVQMNAANFGRFSFCQGANVPSASHLTLTATSGNGGNVHIVTGTTQVDLIDNTSWQNGSVVYLQFNGNCNVTSGTTASGAFQTINLAGGTTFAATANDVLTLVLIGGSWFEAGRSVN